MNGFLVGCGEPPSGSTVTATTAPDVICLLSFTTVVPAPPSNVPAGEADLPATTHASYVLPAGARSRPATTSAPVPPGPTTTAEGARLGVQLSVQGDVPDREADHRARGDRSGGGKRRRPARPQRDDVRTLGAGGIEDPRAELRRGRGRLDRIRE